MVLRKKPQLIQLHESDTVAARLDGLQQLDTLRDGSPVRGAILVGPSYSLSMGRAARCHASGHDGGDAVLQL